MATDVSAVIQGLECSLCLNLLEEPKLLSCTHSFCEKCLQHLHHSQGTGTDLTCPLCRQITRLGTKGLSDLKTNVPLKSLVGDLKTSRKPCTLCDPEAKSQAVHYCQQCDEYMCDTCLKGHAKYKKNTSHLVVSVDDIKSGKVKVKQMCHKHAGEERLFVCTPCKVSICFRCRVLYHSGSDHDVKEVHAFKKNTTDEIKSLMKKCLEKMEKIRSYTQIIKEQYGKIDRIIAETETDINKAYDESLLQLNAKRKTLLDQCKEKKRKLKEELNQYGKNGDDLITSLNSVCELVGNGVRALLEGEALVVHSNLCTELQDMLDRDDPDESKPKQLTSQAKALTFTPCKLKDEDNLGMLNEGYINDWKLEKVATFPTHGKDATAMGRLKYGMVVGYWDGDIQEFTVSGSKTTVLKEKKVWNVSILSDNRYVVRGIWETITLYSCNWTKLDSNKFQMKSYYDYGGMDVDKYDNIFVGYHDYKAIEVFTSEGGAPIREIPCHGYQPYVICTMNHSNMLVVSDGSSSVRVVDQQGTVKHDVTKEGFEACPAVLSDDSILIGWWKDRRVSIDLYTNQFRHVRTVISDLESLCYFWNMGEFSSGEIALIADFKLYILRKFLI